MKQNASPKAGDPLELTIYGVRVVFRYCPPGTFMMGSPEDEECREDCETQHEVTLTRGFWMQETPTTQALWKAVTDKNPSVYKGAERPVEAISWDICAKFINRLNEESWFIGLLDEENSVLDELKFDFPTEAEWEYACRAGTTTPFNFGSTLNGDKANCDGNYPYGTKQKGEKLEGTTPVKSYPANAWGLYDMHGNVWEWCSDWYGLYPSEHVTDPTGAESGPYRVLRGGCWYSPALDCRSAVRNSSVSFDRSGCSSLRLVLRSVE